jgi:hypothetical protein
MLPSRYLCRESQNISTTPHAVCHVIASNNRAENIITGTRTTPHALDGRGDLRVAPPNALPRGKMLNKNPFYISLEKLRVTGPIPSSSGGDAGWRWWRGGAGVVQDPRR